MSVLPEHARIAERARKKLRNGDLAHDLDIEPAAESFRQAATLALLAYETLAGHISPCGDGDTLKVVSDAQA